MVFLEDVQFPEFHVFLGWRRSIIQTMEINRRGATEVKTDERHARGKACSRSLRALDIRYCKRLLSFWVVQLDYAIEEVWNAAMAICI